MPISQKQIEFLARTIVNRLEDRGLVEFGDAEAGIDIVVRTLTDNIRQAEAILQEARERLARAGGDREPTDKELEDEMRRVAADKSFII
jgi:nucleotide-binding universal stress UspA family protein